MRAHLLHGGPPLVDELLLAPQGVSQLMRFDAVPSRRDKHDVSESLVATERPKNLEILPRRTLHLVFVDLVQVNDSLQRYLQSILGCEEFGDFFEDFGIRPVCVVKTGCVDNGDGILFVIVEKQLDGLGRRRC
jgi:hypothetical protein